ncbi:MAG: SDR family NAD(P)-dependent oxidoreductase, partial [Proteobacteria bacterium]|nr:SDR family NAD(P)-dependent oxidoreductase [Pseudomonadota bacterium]
MERFENKAVFITGASSGIGEELARQLVKQGAQVFLFARREDRLKKIANEIDSTQKKVGWMVGDVSSRSDLDR